jgi:hypothetical protein
VTLLPMNGVLRAEWIKFRTVRAWVIAMIAAAGVIVGLALAPGMHGTCFGNTCTLPVGPGGEPVSDSFYFVHQPASGNVTLTVKVSSLRSPVGWAKAGLIMKANLTQGSAYAAIMATPGHGIRMQYDYTGDIAGPAMRAGWLRLTRTGDTITGYASPNGSGWAKVGSVQLAGLPATVPAGIFVTSPQYSSTSLGTSAITGYATSATAAFSGLIMVNGSLTTQEAGERRIHHDRSGSGAWTGTRVGGPGGILVPPAGYVYRAGRYVLTGSGDIAPAVSGASGLGVTIAQTLLGGFVALVVAVIVAATFMTAEYRRGLILATLSAVPGRYRLLAAKATVAWGWAFAAGLIGAALAVPLGQHTLRANGEYVAPVPVLTEIRVIAGTAMVLGLCAVLAVAIGTILRNGAGAVATVIGVIVVPYLLGVVIPVLPLSAADWILRITPAAAFAVQQTAIAYHQVDNVYAANYGYFPLPPWAGLAVLCAWTGLALALAGRLLNGRDA